MYLNVYRAVKLPGKITIPVVVFIIISMAHFKPAPVSINEKADKYYQSQIQSVKEKLKNFKTSCQKKVSLQALRQQFFSCRLAYKKLATLSEYFNIYETKLLNGPALDRKSVV